MPVEFVIRSVDLRQATSHLKASRGRFNDTDFADILVSECVATFRAVGTETEVPVNGKATGSVRVPLRIMDRLRQTLGTSKKELTFLCEPGAIKVGSFSVKHPDIELGRLPKQSLSLPVDASVIDTLALAEILTPEQIVEEAMRARVDEAVETRTRAVSAALANLRLLGISDHQLQDFVDAHIQEAAQRLRRALKISGL